MPGSDDHLHSLNESLDRKDILVRLMKYCAYQERCLSDIDKKLIKYRLPSNVVVQMKKRLIEEGFLDENRFAKMYALGKFRSNQWGKVKIRHGLQGKKIKSTDIEDALDEIDDTEYNYLIQKLIRQKEKRIKTDNLYILRNKIASYLISKGFEPDVVWDRIKEIISQ